MKAIFLTVLLAIPLLSAAQASVKTVPGGIMVLPYVKDNEDIRQVLDLNPTLRIATKELNGALVNAGYKSKDYAEVSSQLKEDALYTTGSKDDFRKYISEKAGAAIEITIDPIFQQDASQGNVVILALSALETSSGEVIASVVYESPRNARGFNELLSFVITNNIDAFLKALNLGYEQLVRDGRPVKVEVMFDSASSLNLSSIVGQESTKLGHLLIDYIEGNSISYDDPKYTGDVKLVFGAVRIPVITDEGKQYKLSNFTRKFEDFLDKQGIVGSVRVSSTGTVMIEIK